MLRYFPYIENRETLPVPYNLDSLTSQKGVSVDPDTVPLQLRKPGLDVYWNGRRIPEAHFDRFWVIVFLSSDVRVYVVYYIA